MQHFIVILNDIYNKIDDDDDDSSKQQLHHSQMVSYNDLNVNAVKIAPRLSHQIT